MEITGKNHGFPLNPSGTIRSPQKMTRWKEICHELQLAWENVRGPNCDARRGVCLRESIGTIQFCNHVPVRSQTGVAGEERRRAADLERASSRRLHLEGEPQKQRLSAPCYGEGGHESWRRISIAQAP